jgi:hypothetical protein
MPCTLPAGGLAERATSTPRIRQTNNSSIALMGRGIAEEVIH